MKPRTYAEIVESQRDNDPTEPNWVIGQRSRGDLHVRYVTEQPDLDCAGRIGDWARDVLNPDNSK